MKKLNVLTAGAFSVILFFVACGGSNGSAENKDEAASAEPVMNESYGVNIAIDPSKSTIRWRGEMLGMYAHEGTIALKEGYIYEENGQLVGGSFRVDMKKMQPTDENYKPAEGKSKEKLVEHLSSPDFFSVDSFPIALFDIIEVGENTLKGNLIIKDIKHPEVVRNFEITEVDGEKRLSGTLTFDRQKYKVSFKHPVQEMVLSDSISLDVQVETTGHPMGKKG